MLVTPGSERVNNRKLIVANNKYCIKTLVAGQQQSFLDCGQ